MQTLSSCALGGLLLLASPLAYAEETPPVVLPDPMPGDPPASAPPPSPPSAPSPPSPTPTPAPPRRSLGQAGTILLSLDRALPLVSYTRVSIESSEGTVRTTTTDDGVSIAFAGREPNQGIAHSIPRLAIDYAITDGFTIGSGLALAFGLAGTHTERRVSEGTPDAVREHNAPTTTIVGIVPRFGTLIPVANDFAFWPRLGLGFYSVATSSEQGTSSAVARSDVTDTLLSLDVEVLATWTPLPHVFFQGGPLFDLPLVGAHKTDFAQAGISKERSDDIYVFHVGWTLGAGIYF